jgi:hypothetical protein
MMHFVEAAAPAAAGSCMSDAVESCKHTKGTCMDE